MENFKIIAATLMAFNVIIIIIQLVTLKSVLLLQDETTISRIHARAIWSIINDIIVKKKAKESLKHKLSTDSQPIQEGKP